MKNIILPLFCFLLFNCSKSENQHEVNAALVEIIPEDRVSMKNADLNSPPPPPQEIRKQKSSAVSTISDDENSKNQNVISKKIIKNGEIDVQVGDIKKTQIQVDEILKANKAYIQSENFNNSDTGDRLQLSIRVPHQNFDAVINSFSNGMGSVLSKNIASDDVTEEYTNVSIKLANKKIYLEKYRDMLKSASTTKDMLEIQENIRALEDEIDVSEGRLRFIDDRVNYSTLDLNLFKEKVRSSTTSKIGFGSRFGDSLTEGWTSFVAFFLGVISLWPFFLLIPIVVFSWKKWKSRRKKSE